MSTLAEHGHQKRDKCRSSEGGYLSIEAALVFPFLLLILLLLTQFIFLVFAKRAAQSAAEQGAEEAAYYQATNNDGFLAAQDAATQIPGLKDATTTVNRDAGSVTVTVSGSPFRLLPISMNVTAQSAAPIEQIVETGARQ